MTTSWRTDFAPTVAELNTCVACGLCLPHCPTFRLTGLETASPRGRIAAMRAVGEGVLEVDADFEEAMTFCLNCRACEAVCPSLVPFGRMMEGARAELAASRPSWRRRARHFVLGRILSDRRSMRVLSDFLRLGQRLRFDRIVPGMASRGLRGLRPLGTTRRRPTARSGSPRIGLLVGCVMDRWFAGVNQAAIDLLELAGCEVEVPADQVCCGALAVHDGAVGAGRRLAQRNVSAFAEVDVLVATAAGCSAHLKGYEQLLAQGSDIAAKARDVTEIIAGLIDEGRLPVLASRGEEVVVHDPCHLRHAQRITAAPRRILAAAGYETVDADPEGLCCGAAGIYSLLRPATSHQLGKRLAAAVHRHGGRVVASANPGCEMQLRAHLGTGFRVVHPVELYLEAIRSRNDIHSTP